MYSAGDFPSTRPPNSAGRSLAARASTLSGASQRTPGKKEAAQGIEAGEVLRRVLALPDALEEQVVEAEGQVEGRLAVPGAFGIEQHRSGRANEDVLRTDVAVHQESLARIVARESAQSSSARSSCRFAVASR